MIGPNISIGGLQQIGGIHGDTAKKVIFWASLFLIAVVLLGLQIHDSVIHMESYPKQVAIEAYDGPLTFPSVTVCNVGLVKKSAVDKFHIIAAMEAILNGNSLLTNLNGTVLQESSNNSTALGNALNCQTKCAFWEPFCLLPTFPNAMNFADTKNYCKSLGGSLPALPSANISIYNRWTDYMKLDNVHYSTMTTWMDYYNPFPYSTTAPGNWTDSFGRSAPFITWEPNITQPIIKLHPVGNSITHGPCMFCQNYLTPLWGTWDKQSTIYSTCMCHCPAIQPPSNGNIIGFSYTDLGESISFGCNAGYHLFGAATITCTYTGSGVDWIRSAPVCLSDCAAINSQMLIPTYTTSDLRSGTKVTFTCSMGFTLYGAKTSTCYNGSWSILPTEYPTCYNITLPVMNKSQVAQLLSVPELIDVNPISTASTFNGFIPYILSGLTDDQMATVGFTESDVIVSCSYDQRECQTASVAAVRYGQGGVCYTFNHRNFVPPYVAIRAGEINGLHMVLHSLQNEYLSFVISGGLQVFIHDQNDPTFYGHSAFMLSPGLTYSISLQKAMEIRVNKPVGTCAENSSELKYYNFDNENYFDEACISSYIQSKIVDNCSCNSPILPFKRSLTPVCGVDQYSCVQQFYKGIDDHLVQQAKTFCPPRCSYTYYKRTSTAWLSKVNAVAAKKLHIADRPTYLKNVIDLSIYFQTLNVITLREELSYTIVSLLSDFGNWMGVLVGMSVISWVELVFALLDWIKWLSVRSC